MSDPGVVSLSELQRRSRDFEQRLERMDDTCQETARQVTAIFATMQTIRWVVGLGVGLMPVVIGATWALGRLVR